MPRLILKFEKVLDSERIFELLREKAGKLSGFLSHSGNSGTYEYMGNPVSIDVAPLQIVFAFMDSGVDPLLRPMEAFSKILSQEYGKPHVGLELPENKRVVWAERFKNLF